MNKLKNFNPFKNLVLDEYEQGIEAAIERGEYRPVKDIEKTRRIFEEAAKRHIELQKSKSVTLRIKKKDLIQLKANAARNKIPYQTLIGLLINRYAEGRIRLSL